MKISVFFAHILDAASQTGIAVPQLLAQLSQAGIRQTELDVCHILPTQPWPQFLNQAGIRPVCVNEHYALEGAFPADQVRNHIEAALLCGADKILVVPGFLSEEEAVIMHRSIRNYEAAAAYFSQCAAVNNMIQNLRTICAMAGEKGLKVVIEDFDHPHSPLSGLNGVRWFLEQVDGLWCNFDTGNFITYDEDVFAAWDQLAQKVIHIHCKDRDDAPVAVGSGRLPLEQLLKKILESGYEGSFAIEHYGAEDQLSCMLHSAAFLSNL